MLIKKKKHKNQDVNLKLSDPKIMRKNLSKEKKLLS